MSDKYMDSMEKDLTLIELIGRNITKYREERNLSRRQLAMRVLIEEAALGFYERGQREAGMFIYLSICDELHITLMQLVGRDVSDATVITDPVEKRIVKYSLDLFWEYQQEAQSLMDLLRQER